MNRISKKMNIPAKKIAITCGDPAGIGPEIVEDWLAKNPEAAPKTLAIGPACWLKNLPCEGVPVGDSNFKIVAGTPSAEGQKIALVAMEMSAKLVAEGRSRAVVTMPINKAEMKKIGYEFPGQTEFFAARWGGIPTMAFAGGKLAVVLATWHIALRDVSTALTDECLARAVERANFLGQKIAKTAFPRIAVCGLNPHAGERGLMGTEEFALNKTLAALRERFPNLSDCLPPDTVFWRQLQGEFDVVVALYHDQALGPVKTLEFEQSVNCSLGLPFVRTSPDHGTAYALAGTHSAQTTSLGNAVRMAEILSK